MVVDIGPKADMSDCVRADAQTPADWSEYFELVKPGLFLQILLEVNRLTEGTRFFAGVLDNGVCLFNPSFLASVSWFAEASLFIDQ